MSEPVCIVTGVGPGTGRAIAERFANEGYQVAMLARRADRLAEYAESNPALHPVPCDVSDEAAVKDAIAKINKDFGNAEVLVHNAVGGAWGDFLSIEPHVLEDNFRVNTMGLLYLAQAVSPAMIAAGTGAIMVTGNTAATRGRPNYAGFAPTKAAQRILAESMARTLGPKGIHVAYLIIDAVIDLAWTRKRNPEAPDSYFAKPSAIADVVWKTVDQDPSTWSFLVEMRPFGETW
ncbi:MAG: SDR family NAD(P)-dependent oxidoreductase [Pseudomonadota bacterium]